VGPVDITTIGVSCDNSVFVLVGEQGKASRACVAARDRSGVPTIFHISHMGAHGKTPASTLFAASHNNRWHCGRQADSTVRLRGTVLSCTTAPIILHLAANPTKARKGMEGLEGVDGA
jgi:hypothetical protein